MRKTAAFWNMSSIHFLGCVGHAIILVYLIPLAVQEGISLVMAASLLTVMSGVSVISRLLTPMLSDRYGPRLVMSACYFLQGVTVFILFWSHDPWTFYLFAVAFAVGYGGESGGFPILNRKYYGHAPMGSPYGFQMLGAGLGMALGGWVGGVIFDMTGGYEWALVISIAASVGGAISILLLERTDHMLIPEWEKQAAHQASVAAQPAASHMAAGDS
ncbi:MAG: MFS transporter [SAR202 cluster bacterium]|nr:MFS transporter [SAR202 cluster bacterium]